MAIRTTQLALIQGLGGELRAEIDWDDTLATVDPRTGEKHADTGDLLRFRVVNSTLRTGRLVIRRPGVRKPWIDVSVPPGMNRTASSNEIVRQIVDANVGVSLSR